MKTFYLVQNLMYNQKHVVKKKWIHKLFGAPQLTAAMCEAESKDKAMAQFIKDGHNLGYTHEASVLWLKSKGYLE